MRLCIKKIFMNSFLTHIAFQLQDFAVRPFVLHAVKTLERQQDMRASFLAESINDAFNGTLSNEEQSLVSKIEMLRKELHASKEIVEITDYGANADSINGTIVQKKIGDVAISSSKPYRWSLLLFFILRRLTPKNCLEFGTCLGISTLFQAAALKQNGSGSILTMEGAPNVAAIAQKNFSSLNFQNITSVVGKFSDVLPSVIEKYQPFDYVFIDGHHEGNATIEYFEQLLPALTPNAIIVFDDIHWSASMKETWQKIIRHTKVKYAVDLYQVGIVTLL